MASEQISVAGIQISQVIGNREANISAAMEAIAAAPGHDIYVLPELSSSGYGVDVFRALEDLAEEASSRSGVSIGKIEATNVAMGDQINYQQGATFNVSDAEEVKITP